MEVDDGPRLGGTAPLSPEANHRSLSIRPLRRRALASTNARPAGCQAGSHEPVS